MISASQLGALPGRSGSSLC